MNSNLRWGLLLALLPAAAAAQTTPHVYVGVSGGLLTWSPFESYRSTLGSPALTVGVQFTPRLAVETGLQLAWQSTSRTYRAIDPNDPTFAIISTKATYFLVPVLARFTLTPEASSLHVDLLGGATWLHGRYKLEFANSYTGGSPIPSGTETANSICATLGPQVRYAFGTGLEAKLSLPFNANLDSGYSSFSDRVFLTAQLGVQYTFH